MDPDFQDKTPGPGTYSPGITNQVYHRAAAYTLSGRFDLED